MRKEIGAIALLVLAAFSGCSGSGGAPAPTSNAPSKVPRQLHPVGAYRDVSLRSCPPGPGVVAASGRITNHTPATTDFVIVASWARRGGKGTAASGSAAIRHLAPGASRSWTIRADVPAGGDAVCSIAATSGPLA